MTSQAIVKTENTGPAGQLPSQADNLYSYQTRAMPILLGWSVGSIVTGALWLSSASKFWRGLGSQFLGWGAIDGLIAGFALRGATKGAARLEAGEISPAEHQRQWLQFERFVWLNVLLDIGYVLAGVGLKRSNPHDPQRQGLGWGIAIQGGFLLIWDILLASLSRSKRRGA
jgi:hypothetical protein